MSPSARMRGVRAARTSVVMSLSPGDRERHRVAAAEAERCEATLEIAILQSVQQRGEHARATRADGMTERDRAAVHVDAIPIPLQTGAVGERLRRERFVRFDQIVVADRRALFLHQVAYRGDRREEQILRAHGARRVRLYAR